MKLIVALFLLSTSIIPFNSEESQNPRAKLYEMHCDEELKPLLCKIQELDEVKRLIAQVREEGPLFIEVNRTLPNTFEGYWSKEGRTVYITNPKTAPYGSLICTLIFELHNAKRSADLIDLNQRAYSRSISKKMYVRSVEMIEHQNALATCKILEKGIALGVFPKSSRWPIHQDFETHFAIQKRSGHSKWIADCY